MEAGRRLLLGSVVLTLVWITVPCMGSLVVNGDWSSGTEDGWTRWGGLENYLVTDMGSGNPTPPEGGLFLVPGQVGAFGWYQFIDVPAGLTVTLKADWAGDLDPAGCWASMMLMPVAPGTTAEDIVARIWAGADEDVAFRKDFAGTNPPLQWPWQPASDSPMPGGNAGSVVSDGSVVVAMKLGNVDADLAGIVWTAFDNIVLTSQPLASVGGPYVLDTSVAPSIIADASASYDPDGGSILATLWDLDGDFDFDDAGGAQVEITPALLESHGWTLGDSRAIFAAVVDDELEVGVSAAALSYIPEPGTLALACVGGVVMLLRARRGRGR